MDTYDSLKQRDWRAAKYLHKVNPKRYVWVRVLNYFTCKYDLELRDKKKYNELLYTIYQKG